MVNAFPQRPAIAAEGDDLYFSIGNCCAAGKWNDTAVKTVKSKTVNFVGSITMTADIKAQKCPAGLNFLGNQCPFYCRLNTVVAAVCTPRVDIFRKIIFKMNLRMVIAITVLH